MSAELIRILVVTGDEPAPDLLEEAFPRQDGYALDHADSLQDGLLRVGRDPIDVVLLELPYPGTTGLEAAALMLASHRSRTVLVLARPESEAIALKAVQQGCSDYFLYGNLYPLVLRRGASYALERARSDRRRTQAEAALADSEQRYRGLFEQSRDAIYMTQRNGEILELNRAALDLLGYGEGELIGRELSGLYADATERAQVEEELDTRGHVRDVEVRLKRKDGEERVCLLSAWVRRDDDGRVEGHQGIIHDITERKRAEDRLAFEAFHDALTGLPNRALFMDRLERALARRRRGEERELAVLFLDLDRFKVVNDSLGHLAGDELLRRVARVLAEEVREEDTVARMSGDEFALLLDGVDDPAVPTHVAERIQHRLRTPFRIHGRDVFTSVSIGITFGGTGVDNPETLLRDADAAMYRAKELGPARYQIFDEGMHRHALSLLQLETDLRLALDRSEFSVHYQPVLELDGQQVTGFEALVRWNHPDRGLILPPGFLPVAEETGLIVPLGESVLRTATRQLREWRAARPDRDSLHVSVNLSSRQFHRSDIVAAVRDILLETGVPPRSLRLDITENTAMQDPRAAEHILGRLHELGVVLCLDDFGTGHSSLSHLHRLPIDFLKIDRGFIHRLAEEAGRRLVDTIIALARSLGIHTIAEGVETEEQLTRLRQLGATAAQGFIFSPPLRAERAGALLEPGSRALPHG